MVRFTLLLSLVSLTAAFQAAPFAVTSRQQQHTIKTSLFATQNDAENSNIMSRRSAIGGVLTAASFIAAGMSPADATDLASQLRQLEKENSDKINSNGAPEKHIPTIAIDKSQMLTVTIPHVMTEEHHIQAMWLSDSRTGEVVVAKALPATSPSPPTLKVQVPKGAKLQAKLYCNLHGLWQGDEFTA